MAGDPNERRTVVAVTGATGYIGAVLCQHLIACDVNVLGLSRRRIIDPRVTHVPYDLRHRIASSLLDGVDAVIHVAAETSRGADPEIEVELHGLAQLLDAAELAGVRFVFVSSQTARRDAPTGYGRLKAQAEEHVLARRGLVARPGQVYGGPEKGLWGSLTKLAKQASFLPRLLPEPPIQPIHVEDLAAALARLALDRSFESRIYAIADPEPVGFSRFLREIARQRFGRNPLPLPLPLPLVFFAGHVALAIGRRLDVARRLKSLSDLPRLDSAADIDRLGLSLRRFPSGVGRPGLVRRRLLREGRLLLQYVLAAKPDFWMARRYVRALTRLGDTKPLVGRRGSPFNGSMLRLFDQPAARRRAGVVDALNRRVDLAILIAESAYPHAGSFLLDDHLPTRIRQIGSAGLTGLLEVVCRPIDLAIGKAWLDHLRPRATGSDVDDL